MGFSINHTHRVLLAVAASTLITCVAPLQVSALYGCSSSDWVHNDYQQHVDLYLGIAGVVLDLEPVETSFTTISSSPKAKPTDLYRLLTPTSKYKQQFFPKPIICSPTGIYMCLRL